MRFSIQTLLVFVAFVAAFFAGRASLTPVIREHERQEILQNDQIQSLEKAKSELTMRMALAREQRLSEDEIRHRDTMRELDRARNRPQLLGPELLAPNPGTPWAP